MDITLMDDLWRIEIEVVAVTYIPDAGKARTWSGRNRPGIAELGLVLGVLDDGLHISLSEVHLEWNMTVERVDRPEGAPWPPLSRESAMTTSQQRMSSSSVPQGKRASASCSAWPERGRGRG